MKKKKKFKMFYVYIGIIVVLFGAIIYLNNNETTNALYGKPASKLNPATRELLDDPNYQNIILPAELDKKIADKEDFFVYLFASDCNYCRQTTPELMPLAKELGVDLPQFNLREFETYFKSLKVEYTPTLAYFKDGMEVERLEGGLAAEGTTEGYTLDDFKQFFNKYSGEDSQ
ncbi:thioredoxin family protein [Paenibacillus harenae]|uniref:Thiol-disulfide isomerase/thioredoxin n=1 Tax=Paenibacillus harenae TaxID=306543 RepID=A0ABT9TXG4_PAEHA|nr:thioredoxin family protein [Paenibacillus harenae]MDQ0111762.1 thiol-disulfide isomerase/thioredoxin [Paenibacillus harenae]